MYRRWILNLWVIFAALFYLALVGRLFTIQVLQKNHYGPEARKQSRTEIKLYPERGIIYDRNYKMLAFDVNQYSYGVDPSQLQDKHRIAQIFARLTGNSRSYYLNLLNKDGFVWLARGIDQKTSEILNFDKAEPIAKVKEIGRYYPYQKGAAHVLGFTNIDNSGIAGVERKYNQYLKGEAGYKIVHVDAGRQLLPVLGEPEKVAVNGQSIVLSLDINYQLIVEEELKRGVEKFKARSGMVVMLDPYTGQVLALASFPGFNPNHIESYSDAERRNRALVDPFEPGSTFKIVTAAAALQEGILQSTDKIFCENGKKMFPGGWITDHKKYSTLTFKEVFTNSSNIGFAKISQKVGAKRIYRYGRALGFGSTTDIDLLGEDRGKFTNYVHWSASDAVRIPIGYGVLTTGIQMANAYAAVANGGFLMKPKLLKAVLSRDTQEMIQETKPDTIRRVLTNETVVQLKSFMQAVVESGTGKNAAIEGVPIAGKTGTSKKFDQDIGGYSDQKYVASFVGFTPVKYPKLVCLVVLDEPAYPYYYGGLCAAPIFRNIVRRVLGSVTEPKDNLGAYVKFAAVKPQIRVPDVTELSLHQAKAILQDYQFDVQFEGKGRAVMAQQPAQGTLLNSGDTIKLILGENEKNQKKVSKLPDVRGKSVREAVQILLQAGYNPVPEGSGYVVSQNPPPNTLPKIQKCRIVCRPISGR